MNTSDVPTEPSTETNPEIHVIEMKPEQQAQLSAYWADQNKRLVAVRSKDREFHGLQREFWYEQAEMLQLYEKSKDIHHPRDVGQAREAILGHFLEVGGYLPKRYSVSNTSTRVVSTEGFTSRELDILLFDAEESMILMQRKDAFEVYPAESAYGAIQVKSKLTKGELRSAFENIASYKKLQKIGIRQTRHARGFGIIFAYDTDSTWARLAAHIEEFAGQYSRAELPNAIVVLNKGHFVFGDDTSSRITNAEIQQIQELRVFGQPDRQGDCLYTAYLILMTLLRDGEAPAVPIERYFALPMASGKHSYEFSLGLISELGECHEHGDYLRKIDEAKLDKVFAYCRNEKPMTYYDALHGAYGDDWNVTPQNNSQLVFVYNPENRPLSEVLLAGSAKVFDELRSADMTIFIPHCYSQEDAIIAGCPKCAREAAKLSAGDSAEVGAATNS